MTFHVKPLQDIKRALFAETINLLKHHQVLKKEYDKKLDKPDAKLIEAIKKLGHPRSMQVEFLWTLLDVLDRSTIIGLFAEVLDEAKKARCFTGIALVVLEQISNTYTLRDPSYSHLYEGLQRVIGMKEEGGDLGIIVNEMDLASKLSFVSYANKFLTGCIYENKKLSYAREKTYFSGIKKLDLHEMLNTALGLVYSTSLEAHAVARKNTAERAEQREQQAKERAKAAEPAKGSYLFRVFGGSNSATSPSPSNLTHISPN